MMDIYSRTPGTQIYTGPPVQRPQGFVGPMPPRKVDLTPPPPESVAQTFTKPLLPTKEIGDELGTFLVGPFDWFHRTAIDAAMGLASPMNVGLAALTGGVSSVEEAASNVAVKTAARAIQAGASAYFGSQAGKAAIQQAPEMLDAYNRGDYYTMFKSGGRAVVDGVFAAAATAHAASTFNRAVPDLVIAASRKTAPPPQAPDGMPALSPEAGSLRLPPLNLKSVETDWIDQFSPIRDFEKMAATPKEDKAYTAARQFAAHSVKIASAMGDARRILYPIAKKGLKPELDKALMLETVKEDFANKPNYKAPGGLTAEQVDAELAAQRAQLGPEKMAQVDLAARQMRMYGRNFLQIYHDAGLISDEALAAMDKGRQLYAPLQRLAFFPEDADKLPVGGRSFNVGKQSVVYGREGSTKEVLPPTEGFLRNAVKMITLAEKNKVTLRLASYIDDPVLKDVIRPLGKNEKPEPGEGLVTAFVDGTKTAYAVPKPLADSVSGLNVSDIDKLSSWVKQTSRSMVLGSTRFNPPFLIGNTLRSYQAATLRAAELAPYGATPFTPWDWLKGFSQTVTGGPYYDAYMQSGAGFSGFFERQANIPKTMARVIEPQWQRVVRNLMPWEAMRIAAQTVELAPRVGYLQKALEAGVPLETAGMMTRDAGVDYSRMGAKMKEVNMWVPFINTRLQGALTVSGAVKNYPVKSALALTAIVGLPGLFSYVHNTTQYPQVWQDISQREKDNNFLVILGDDKDKDGNYTKVFKIPKENVGRFFWNPIEDFLEWHRSTNPQSFRDFAEGVLMDRTSDASPVRFADRGSFSWPALTESLPPILKGGIIEPIANRNMFTGRQIATEEQLKGSPKKRYTSDTPRWVVKGTQALPSFLHVSPVMAQNFMETTLGGAGRLIAGDVPRGKDEVAERTAWGPVKRVLMGARGGGEDQRRIQEARPIAQAAADVNLERDRTSEQIYLDMMEAPAEKRFEFLQSQVSAGKLDYPTFEKLYSEMRVGVKGRTSYEKYIHSLSTEAKAAVLADALNYLPDGPSRVRLLQRFADIGDLSVELAKQTVDTYERMSAGRTPPSQDPIGDVMDRIYGVPHELAKPPDPLGDAMDKIYGVKK
jgi:hypothetical protein